MKGRKQNHKRCNYKAAVALQYPVRKRWKPKGSEGTCIVLVSRIPSEDSTRSTLLRSRGGAMGFAFEMSVILGQRVNV